MAPRLLTAKIYPCLMLEPGDSNHHMAFRTRILRILGGVVSQEISGETAPLVDRHHHLALAGTRASLLSLSNPLLSSPMLLFIDFSFPYFLLPTTHHINIFGLGRLHKKRR